MITGPDLGVHDEEVLLSIIDTARREVSRVDDSLAADR